jgi:uncharacterized SAM-binding protein YcdF (DUF218 family)
MTGAWRTRRAAAALGIVIGLLAGAWGAGLVLFAAGLGAGVEDRDTVTDAIVVLTGGSDRLTSGLVLLEAGKGRKLFVSGVHKAVDLPDLLRRAHLPPSDALPAVVLGHAADDTVGNAIETAAWMEAEGFASLRLVTAAYHMKRAALEFRRAMPREVIIPHPVYPDAFKTTEWWRWPGTAHLLATEYTKYLAARLRHLFFPKLSERKS